MFFEINIYCLSKCVNTFESVLVLSRIEILQERGLKFLIKPGSQNRTYLLLY